MASKKRSGGGAAASRRKEGASDSDDGSSGVAATPVKRTRGSGPVYPPPKQWPERAIIEPLRESDMSLEQRDRMKISRTLEDSYDAGKGKAERRREGNSEGTVPEGVRIWVRSAHNIFSFLAFSKC